MQLHHSCNQVANITTVANWLQLRLVGLDDFVKRKQEKSEDHTSTQVLHAFTSWLQVGCNSSTVASMLQLAGGSLVATYLQLVTCHPEQLQAGCNSTSVASSCNQPVVVHLQHTCN
jgi:hypothetical protein